MKNSYMLVIQYVLQCVILVAFYCVFSSIKISRNTAQELPATNCWNGEKKDECFK